jgi:ribosomal protein L40E
MKVEAIIAVRGEKPENLIRTVEQASKSADVCVVFDGDEKGNECPDAVRNMARTMRVEGRPCGCGYARNAGIESSDADLIVILDGHMKLPDGWAKKFTAHHTKNPKALTCTRMQSLNQDWQPIGDPDECGAYIQYKSTEPHGLHYALTAKWNKEKKKSGPVGCVLGACYGITREWYDRIGRPLSILRAWGGDEEILSISTHLCGGSVYMLPMTVGHVYAAVNVGRVRTADEEAAIWGNRHAVIDAIPMEEQERDHLHAWLASSNRIDKRLPPQPQEVQMLRELLESVKVKSLHELKAGRIIVCADGEADEYKGRPTHPPPAPPTDKAQIIMRKLEICDRCGARDSFVQIRGRINTPTFGMAYARCRRCGHKGQLRIIR